MRISSIKPIIQNPIKKLMPFALGAMTVVGCAGPTDKIKEYCEITNKTGKEYVECINGKSSNPDWQATLDSMVYRDLLNTTNLAKDSATIAEFNKLSTSFRYKSSESEITKKFLDAGVSAKYYNDYKEEPGPTARQFLIDGFIFGKFFTEKGLMSGEFKKSFEHLTSYLNPYNHSLITLDNTKDAKCN